MATKWTEDQAAAIDSRNQSLLVAAAAGSGKTAVLTERIIQRLKDKDHPLQVQELLVTTFTKASAGEMKTRIGSALASELKKEDLDQETRKHLENQLKLLPSAQISTLHSFCQWVIQSYFYAADINPRARIGNDGEMALMRSEILHDLIVGAYDRLAKDPDDDPYHIYALADMFSDDKSDANLEELVLAMYTFAMAMANPKKWLLEALDDYRQVLEKPFLETTWGSYFWQDMKESMEGTLKHLSALYEMVQGPMGMSFYQDHYDVLKAKIAPFEAAMKAGSWDAFHRALATYDGTGYKQFRENKQTKAFTDEGLKAQAKVHHNEVKNYLAGLKESVFAVSEAAWREQVKDQIPVLEGLINLTLDFKAAYDKAKHDGGLMDFNDLEHLCLKILIEPGTEDQKIPEPSQVAKELQDRFQEIMVDEYQDTSGVQEAIINLVSRDRNRFYVGDVKQSIYSFRMADSDLFMGKYLSFKTDQDGDDLGQVTERRIDLAKNFRSDKNVLAVTNFIFYQIMSAPAAELDYGLKEALVPGRVVKNPPDGSGDLGQWIGGSVDLLLADVASAKARGQVSDETDEDDPGETPEAQDIEMALIVDEIKKYTAKDESGRALYTVQDKDGSFRPVEYRDIAVLRRSLAGYGNRLVEALRNAGIPAYVEENTGYFESMEIQLILALLQIIDNPEQDLPMAAVLRSPMVGLTANQIGQIRLLGKTSLWSLLPDYLTTHAGQDPDAVELVRLFIERMKAWRTMARRQGAADLLWNIYQELDYVNYVSALPKGLVRRANVLALLGRAQDFESSGFKGLFRFLRFVENLRDSSQDLAVAKVLSEADNVVRIMTIHKSKGLEFPLVFLSGVQKKFNMQDLNRSLLLHKKGGIGLKGYYQDYRIMYPSLASLYNAQLKKNALKAEEERILYVALTRARDKLILTGTIENKENIGKSNGAKASVDEADDTKVSLAQSSENKNDTPTSSQVLTLSQAMADRLIGPALAESGRQLPKDLILSANSYLDWILMAFARHGIGGNLLRVSMGDNKVEIEDKDILNEMIPDRENSKIHVEILDGSAYQLADRAKGAIDSDLTYIKKATSSDGQGAKGNEELLEDAYHKEGLPKEVLDRFNFSYGFSEATRTAAKISVSEIKRRFQEAEEEARALNEDRGHDGDYALAAIDQAKAGEHEGLVGQDAFDPLGQSKALDQAIANSPFGRKPAFLEDPEEDLMAGAHWGTLMHEAMQYLPLADYDQASLQKALDSLVDRGFLRLDEATQLDQRALLAFFQSPLADRMRQSVRVERELPFSMLYPGQSVYPNLEEGEDLFLQGIIDSCFLEEGAWVLVDYKTDRLYKEKDFVDRYHVQLELYCQALAKVTGIPVKEAYIYSFRLGKAISLEI